MRAYRHPDTIQLHSSDCPSHHSRSQKNLYQTTSVIIPLSSHPERHSIQGSGGTQTSNLKPLPNHIQMFSHPERPQHQGLWRDTNLKPQTSTKPHPNVQPSRASQYQGLWRFINLKPKNLYPTTSVLIQIFSHPERQSTKGSGGRR